MVLLGLVALADVTAHRRSDACATRLNLAEMLGVADHRDPVVTGRTRLLGTAPTGRCVIDHDELEVGERLTEERGEAGVEGA